MDALEEQMDREISIHALREEGDAGQLHRAGQRRISIHALREEGDRPERRQGKGLQISIHALREEGDRFVEFFIGKLAEFLSTPSARRATWTSSDASAN